jgi:hypothetical protein
LAVITSERQPEHEKYVDMAYSLQRLRQAYELGWPNITDRSQWLEVQKDFKLYPPIAKKRGVGRKRKNRIPSCLKRIGKASNSIKGSSSSICGTRWTNNR